MAEINMSIIDWKKYFDQIFCVQFLPHRKVRGERICNELERVGILNSGIFQWKYSFSSPFYSVLKNNIPIRHQNVRDKQTQFDISLTHYEIYKFAYEFEYSRILILEDDVVFLKDLNEIKTILDNSPNTDIVLYDKFAYNKYHFLALVNSPQMRINDNFMSFSGYCFLGSAACYSLNQKAISVFIQQEETNFYSPDELWNNWNDNIACQQLTKSFATTNLAMQKQYKVSNSGSMIDSLYDNIIIDKSKYS